MSEKDSEIGVMKQMLTSFVEQSKRTDTKLDTLVDSVQQLTASHIESKKDREADNARMERIEETQKEQGATIKATADTVLILNERMTNNKDRWKWIGGIFGSVVTALLVGVFVI